MTYRRADVVSVGRKLLLSLLGIGFLPAVMALFFSWWYFESRTIDDKIRQMQSLALVQKARLEAMLLGYHQITELIASRTYLIEDWESFAKSGSPRIREKMKANCDQVFSLSPNIDHIQLISFNKGKETEICFSNSKHHDKCSAECNYSSILHLPDATIKESQFLGVNHEKDGRISLSYGRPLFVGERCVGLLIVTISGADLMNFSLNYSGMGRTGEVVLAHVADTGEVKWISRRRHEGDAKFKKHLSLRQEGYPMVNAVKGDRVVYRDAVDYAEHSIVAVTEFVESVGWGLVAKIDRDEVLGDIVRLRYVCFLGLVLLIPFIVLIAYFLRRRLTAAIEESNFRFRLLSDGMMDWVHWVHPDKGTIYVSPSCKRITGYDESEFYADPGLLKKMVHPEDQSRWCSHVDNELKPSCSDLCEMQIRINTQGGETRWIRHICQPIYGLNGEWLGRHGCNSDITDRVRAEETIRRSEERLALATQAGSVGVWDWVLAKNELHWDDSMFRLYGVKREYFSGAYDAWQNGLHPEDRKRGDAEIQMALRGDRPFDTEFRVVHPDGQVRYIKAMAHVFRDKDGKAIRMTGTNWDITERKQSESRMAELLEFNQKIFLKSTQGIKVFHRSGKCISVNPAASIILGRKPEEMLAENFYQIEFWKTSGVLEAALEAFEKNEPQHLESYVTTQAGKTAWLNYDITPFISSGEPNLLVLINDVTHFRRTEQTLLKAKLEAEQANKAKSDFLANMSHEIRTPMNAIIGLSHLALCLELPAKLQDYLIKIEKSAKALLALINDILDYSKIEAGRVDIESVEFSLEEVLENVANLFSVHAEEKGIEILFDVKSDVPDRLVGDALRLGQILNNLVGNALKFTERGEVRVNVEREPSIDSVANLRFEVLDTGIGMTQEQMKMIFQSFTQADGSITRRFGGTGLGLTISKQLVKKMEGDMWVNSEIGKGSSFFFNVCLRVPDTAKRIASAESFKSTRVLVVDDNANAREILCDILSGWGCHVSEVSDGGAVIGVMLEANKNGTPFDLLLMDWKMPGTDGVQVARLIDNSIKEGKLPHMPVIIMVTAHSKEHLLEAADKVHLDSILTKPVVSSRLHDEILRLRSGGQTERAVMVRSKQEFQLPPGAVGARVLLVEDNEINRQVAKELLEQLGLEIILAMNGKDALDILCSGESVDIVLMDLHMPVMDGFEATRRIRQDARFVELPILAMTAAVMTSDRKKCIAAGMDDHVSKPVVPEDLCKTLAKWIPSADRGGAVRQAVPATVADHKIGLPEKLPGLDLGAALKRMKVNEPVLFDLLMEGHLLFSQEREKFHQVLVCDNHEEAMMWIHRIKGVSGTLGAMNLMGACEVLEEKIKTGLDDSSIKMFEQSMDEAINSLEMLFASRNIAPTNDADRWKEAIAIRSQVAALLEKNEWVPPEQMRAMKQAFAGHQDAEILEFVERLVGVLDYKNALLKLKEMRDMDI